MNLYKTSTELGKVIVPSLPEAITVVRTSKDRQVGNPFPDMRGKQVLLLNTMGELNTIYALGNVCFVGRCHHIFEPAITGKPILYFEGDWGAVNKDAKDYLVDAGGALVFNKRNLQLLMNDREQAKSVGEKGIKAVHKLKEKDIPNATNVAALGLLANVLLKTEGILIPRVEMPEGKTPQDGVGPMNDYVNKNGKLFKEMLGEEKYAVLVRVPLEAIESVGADDAKDFLTTFQEAPNCYVELYYMSGIGEISEDMYQKYGLQKKLLPKDFKRDRENTVTLFPSLKGEKISQSVIVSRLGDLNVTPDSTILSPIGLQHDPVGLIRATILGLKMMGVARQVKENGINIVKDQGFKDGIQTEILEQLKNVCDAEDLKNFNLTPDDIIALATGTVNDIIPALRKLTKLLPIAPINADELRQIYEHVKQVMMAA